MVDATALKAYGLSDADIASLMSFTPDMNFGTIDLSSGLGPLAGVGTYSGDTKTFTAPLSNKGNPTSKMYGNVFAVTPTSNVRLVNNATGEIVYSGTGYDAAQKATELAQGLTDQFGRKANWDIQTDTSGRFTGGPDMFESVANEKPNKTTLGTIGSVLGTALPIAMIPLTMGASAPLAGLSTAGTIGLGAGVGAASAGLKGQNILKGAVMGGLTSAGGQLLGGATGPLSGLGTDVGTAVGTGLGATAGGLATGQNLKNSLIGGVTAGGMQYLGGKLFGPSQAEMDFQRNLSQNVNNTIADMTNAGFDIADAALIDAGYYPKLTPSAAPSAAPSSFAVAPASSAATSSTAPSDYTATGTRLSGPTFFGGNNLLTTARYSGDGPTPSDYTLTAKTDADNQAPPSSLAVDTGATPPASDYTLTAKTDANNQTPPSSLAVNTGATTPASDYTLTAKTDSNNQTPPSSLAVDTGGYTPPGDNIDVEAKKTTTDEKETGTGTPPPTDLLDQITDPEVKKALEKGRDEGMSLADIASYLRLLGLGTGLVGSLFGGGGGGGSGVRYTGGNGGLNPNYTAKLPPPTLPGAADNFAVRPNTDFGVVNGQPRDWNQYGFGPEASFFNYVPQRGSAPVTPASNMDDRPTVGMPVPGDDAMYAPEYRTTPTGKARGGSFAAKHGGAKTRTQFAVQGPGDGRSDDIPAMLSDGEYVMDAETVALLGNGSPKAGAKALDQFRVNLRKHKGQKLAKGKFSVNAKRPERYLVGGRS